MGSGFGSGFGSVFGSNAGGDGITAFAGFAAASVKIIAATVCSAGLTSLVGARVSSNDTKSQPCRPSTNRKQASRGIGRVFLKT